jgi:hypothetical protein
MYAMPEFMNYVASLRESVEADEKEQDTEPPAPPMSRIATSVPAHQLLGKRHLEITVDINLSSTKR